MATAFTEQEKQQILRRLRQEARRCASHIGMKKTTVDQLAESAGISKGAFYKFYPTKEALFLEVLEEWHSELYEKAAQAVSYTHLHFLFIISKIS